MLQRTLSLSFTRGGILLQSVLDESIELLLHASPLGHRPSSLFPSQDTWHLQRGMPPPRVLSFSFLLSGHHFSPHLPFRHR